MSGTQAAIDNAPGHEWARTLVAAFGATESRDYCYYWT
jgi:hypothetical protein